MRIQPKMNIDLKESSVTNAGTATAAIDTLGFKHLALLLTQSTSNNTTNKVSVCKLSESDTTDATNYSDIAAFVGGGAGGWTIPAASTTATEKYQFHVNLLGRKRYIKLTVSPVTTQTFSLASVLTTGEQPPVTAAGASVDAFVEG